MLSTSLSTPKIEVGKRSGQPRESTHTKPSTRLSWADAINARCLLRRLT